MSRHDEWMAHGYFRTYEVAGRLASIARVPHARELEGLLVDGGLLEFIPNWQKETAIHRFVKWIAHDMFLEDTGGPYVTTYVQTEAGVESVRRLPVDCAMEAYGISSDGLDLPPPDGEVVEVRPRMKEWRESSAVANLCCDYFTEELMLSQEYEDLLDRLAGEVFQIFFLNRRALAGLHEYLAGSVSDVDIDSLREVEESDFAARPLAKLFAADGRLKRVATPMWAKRAVYFREHGKCAACRRDVSGLLDAIPSEQYDHVVPLAVGGLNDVSNLQLLCADCNNKKSKKAAQPSSVYRRWYRKS